MVSGRDCTRLVDGVSEQVALVQVLWPTKASERITAAGEIGPQTVDAVHRHLAAVFPTA